MRRSTYHILAVALAGFCIPAFAAGAEPTSQADGALRLVKGEFWFRHEGELRFLLGRNPTGREVEQFATLLKWGAASGERIVRIHLQVGRRSQAAPGKVDPAWVEHWEKVFDIAAAEGMHVLPVFSAWARWNDGSRNEPWHSWHRNPYNAELGGPAKVPAEFLADTECRKLWLQWLGAVVRRWQGRKNILGWEVFSELDLITGATEQGGVDFMRAAAKVVREADGKKRPVTASLAGVREWPKLFADDALDFIQVHPYANVRRFKGRLDELILHSVRARRKRYGKAVLIGESGLSGVPLADSPAKLPRAPIGIGHAIWAAAVSGAASGRMLWWEDGYDQYSKIDLRTKYKDASAPVARFVAGVNYAGFRPIDVTLPRELFGAALGDGSMVLAWFRDAKCVFPEWPVRRIPSQTVVLNIPAGSRAWTVTFHDTATGKPISTKAVRLADAVLTVPLPAFEGSIALKASPVAAPKASK